MVHTGFWLMLMSSCGVFAFKLTMQIYWKKAYILNRKTQKLW